MNKIKYLISLIICICIGYIITLFSVNNVNAQELPYTMQNLHQSLIQEDEAMAELTVPLGLTKDEVMKICKNAVEEIEKRCDTKMNRVRLHVFHENTVKREGFTCAIYILDKTGRRPEPETLSFNNNYFTDPSLYEIKGLNKTKAIELWYELLRAENTYGIGTDKTQEVTAKLFEKYGVDLEDKGKLITWSMVDNFGKPE